MKKSVMGQANNKMQTKLYPKAIYELRASAIAPGQVGLFSLESFKKGSVVINKTNWDEGRLIPWNEYETLDSSTQRQLIYFCYKTEEGIHAPADINKLNIGYFVNHSCDPLLICDSNGDYIALKDIGLNEELTIDVEELMQKTIHSFECSCGAKNCRKVIKI